MDHGAAPPPLLLLLLVLVPVSAWFHAAVAGRRVSHIQRGKAYVVASHLPGTRVCVNRCPYFDAKCPWSPSWVFGQSRSSMMEAKHLKRARDDDAKSFVITCSSVVVRHHRLMPLRLRNQCYYNANYNVVFLLHTQYYSVIMHMSFLSCS